MTVAELLEAMRGADPSWEVSVEFEDLSGWGPGRRLDEQYAASVRVGVNEFEGVTISTQPA